MLDIETIRKKRKKVEESLEKRKKEVDLDVVLELDEKRRELIPKIEKLRARINEISEGGRPTEEEIKKAKEIKKQIKRLEPELEEVEEKLQENLFKIPNLLHPSVPEGKDENDNQVLRKWKEPRKFDFPPRDHLELGRGLDIIDTESSAKVSGSRFCYLKNEAVFLQFALVRWAFKVLTDKKILGKIAKEMQVALKSFVPVIPPMMVKEEIMKKMARLEPAEDKFRTQIDGLYLVGSAEHSLGPIFLNETLDEEEMPQRFVGYSTSFRREAGSYGKDTRGILRVHQFDKLEMESFTTPEVSEKEQDFLIAIQEYLMQQLGIPYRVVAICTGDMGDPDYRQVDIEAWLPAQGKYRETHTADLMTDYQSRRLNTKVRRKNGERELVHMNDATAFAIGRTLIAILENYQNKDGSVEVPRVLQKYAGFKKISKK